MFRTCTTLVAALALLSAPVLAGTFKVPGDFDSIQQAVNTVGDSDTIVLGNQTFAENVVIDGKMNLKIISKGKAVIDGQGKGPALRIVNSTNIKVEKVSIIGGTHGIEVEDSSGIELTRLRIDGSLEDGIHIERSDGLEVTRATITGGEGGIAVEDSDDVELEKNRIDGVLEDAIAFSADGATTSNDNVIERNTIVNAGDGIVVVGTDNEIFKNKISDILGDAIEVADPADEGGGGSSSGNVVVNNQIKGVGEDGIILQGFNNTAEKNKLEDIGQGGICARGVGGHHLRKNGVTRAGLGGVEVDSGSTANTVDGNSITLPLQDGLEVSSDNNDITSNKVNKAGATAFEVEGTNNEIKGNRATKSGMFGLSDDVGGNTYQKNKFDSVDPEGVQP
jgi:parallel beta-helix repeat protein